MAAFTISMWMLLLSRMNRSPAHLLFLEYSKWADIEELDIRDLQDAIEGSSHPDIIQVYQALLDGSYNHLRAFVGAIEERTGEIYEPEVLSKKELNAILDESADQGAARARGRQR